MLQQAEPGYGGEVVLAAGDNKRLVRQLLKVATAAVGYALDFRPTKDPTRIYFRVITLDERAAHPKSGARPRKRAACAGLRVAPCTRAGEAGRRSIECRVSKRTAPGQPRTHRVARRLT